MNSFFISLFIYICCLSSIISIDKTLSESIMYIRFGEEMFLINLYDNPIRKEIISLMPLKSNPIEKNNLKYLPLSLEIEEEYSLYNQDPIVEADVGDIFLFQRKEIIIINKKTNFDNTNGEYIKLGKTDFVNELYDSMKFNNKPVYLWNSYNYADYNEKIKPHEYYMSIMNFLTWKILTVICFLFL